MSLPQETDSPAKCAQCGRVVPLVRGGEVCRTCERLAARRFGAGAITGVIILSLVPIVCGLALLWVNAPDSRAMTLLYKVGGFLLIFGGPATSLSRGMARGGLSGVLTALLLAVLAPLIAFALFVIDFFGIIGRGYGV
jgi:ribosomal protein S14